MRVEALLWILHADVW